MRCDATDYHSMYALMLHSLRNTCQTHGNVSIFTCYSCTTYLSFDRLLTPTATDTMYQPMLMTSMRCYNSILNAVERQTVDGHSYVSHGVAADALASPSMAKMAAAMAVPIECAMELVAWPLTLMVHTIAFHTMLTAYCSQRMCFDGATDDGKMSSSLDTFSISILRSSHLFLYFYCLCYCYWQLSGHRSYSACTNIQTNSMVRTNQTNAAAVADNNREMLQSM